MYFLYVLWYRNHIIDTSTNCYKEIIQGGSLGTENHHGRSTNKINLTNWLQPPNPSSQNTWNMSRVCCRIEKKYNLQGVSFKLLVSTSGITKTVVILKIFQINCLHRLCYTAKSTQNYVVMSKLPLSKFLVFSLPGQFGKLQIF